MKSIKILAATAAIGALLTAPAMADVSTSIYYNGELLQTTQPVVNVDGRVLLAFRDLFENLDGEVSWSDEFRMASVTYGKTTVNLFPDTGAVQINGVPQSLAVGPQIIDDRVYLPLRFVAQALGGTVDYTKGPDDTGVIHINTIDSVQNYAQKDGKVLSILRTTTTPVNTIQPTAETQSAYQQWLNHNSAYFVDDHGNLVEVQSYDQKIQVNVIDYNNAKVDTAVYDTDLLYPALGSVSRDGLVYSVGLNETAQSRYLGVGQPVSSSYEDIVETENGDLYVYNGRDDGRVFRFDAADDSAGFGTVGRTGKVLDLAPNDEENSDNVSATLSDGTAAYLINGRLVILSPDNEVKAEERLLSRSGDRKIYTLGDQFVVIAVENDRQYPEVYAAVYNRDGSVAQYSHNVSRLTEVADGDRFYDYNNLQIRDMVMQGSTVYMLLKTDMDFYIVTYNARTNTSTKEMLSIREKNYDGFIYTTDGIKLFASDADYYYLRDVD